MNVTLQLYDALCFSIKDRLEKNRLYLNAYFDDLFRQKFMSFSVVLPHFCKKNKFVKTSMNHNKEQKISYKDISHL